MSLPRLNFSAQILKLNMEKQRCTEEKNGPSFFHLVGEVPASSYKDGHHHHSRKERPKSKTNKKISKIKISEFQRLPLFLFHDALARSQQRRETSTNENQTWTGTWPARYYSELLPTPLLNCPFAGQYLEVKPEGLGHEEGIAEKIPVHSKTFFFLELKTRINIQVSVKCH